MPKEKRKEVEPLRLLISFLGVFLATLAQDLITFSDSHIFLLTAGVASGFTFIWGPKQSFAIFFACLSGYTLISEQSLISTLPYASLVGFTLSLQSIAVYVAYQQFSAGSRLFEKPNNLLSFFAIAFLGSLVFSAMLSVNESAFISHRVLPLNQVLDLFLANFISVTSLSCLFCAWTERNRDQKFNIHNTEALLWAAALLVMSSASFVNPQHTVIFLLPLALWAAARFNLFWCSLMLGLCSFVALPLTHSTITTAASLGDWMSHNQSSLSWVSFVVVLLYLNNLLICKIRTEQQLDELVQQRTMDLSTANQELKDEIFIREQAEKAQRSASKRYRALIETAGIPIIVLDHNLCIRQWNRAAESIFGYAREQILGTNFIDHFIPSAEQDELAWKLTRIMESAVNQESVEVETCSSDGEQHTMLWNINRLPGSFDDIRERQFLLIGQNISDIRETQDQLHYLAHFDALTGCANRRLFEDRCAQAIQSAIRHKNNIALIGLDIDHFKRINDTLGHDTGDAFLVELANRLKECVRREDTIARLGGDEFAVLLANVNGREGAEVVARNMLELITQPMKLKGNELVITSSIGITLCPADGTHYPDLLKNADMAMYRAKKAGRNNIQFYSPEMNEEMQRQLQIEQELRIALKEQQFELYYQPVVDIESGEIVALEALLRWQHPQRGMLRPGYFLHVAEQSGVLHEIGQWALQKTCEDGLLIQTFTHTPVQLALNLSSRQYHHPNLLPWVKEVTEKTGFDPRQLILEMSESTLTDNTERSVRVLHELSKMGISLTIDSFGTGLSSLRQIKQIPIDIIKIDRSFVNGIPEDENDMTITETLLTVATQMDMKTFASGVETKEQEAFLKINGCRYAQGYLYSAPLPLNKLEKLFKNIANGESLRAGDQIYLPFNNKNVH